MRATTASLRSRAPTATPPTAIPPYVSDTSLLFGATTMLDPYVSRSAWALSVREAVIAKSATTVPTPMSSPATRKADREVRRRRLREGDAGQVHGSERPERHGRIETAGAQRRIERSQ